MASCFQVSSYTITITIIFHQTLAVVHALQSKLQMRMTFDKEVTYGIYFRCECHPISVEDVVESLHAARYDTLLPINSLAWPYSKSILIVYFN